MVFEQIFSELHITKPSYGNNYVDAISAEMRLKRIAKRQMDSTSMFNRLQVIIDQIEENFNAPTSCNTQASPPPSAACGDHNNYIYSNSSSGVSSSSSSTASPPSVDEQIVPYINAQTTKRKIIDDECQDLGTSEEITVSPSRRMQPNSDEIYPKHLDDVVILGPNGTQIDVRSYSSIIWSSAASATRQLLAFIFSSDILATHTLTGKPSPAFHGRERPAKMQLDPIKAADIIHCVKSKFNCTEREIRAAITTKCSDTSKKYKRRSQKMMDSGNK